MILGATEQDTAPHISQSNVLGNSDGFTFKVCLDSNPYYLGSSHIALCELLLVLISILGSPTPTIYPYLSS